MQMMMMMLLRIRPFRLLFSLFSFAQSLLFLVLPLLFVLAVLSMVNALVVPQAVQTGVYPLADVTDRFLAGPRMHVLYVPLQPS